MSSSSGKKSSGLRILWIPGGRKSHPKGRYDSTNKTPSYRTGQKKSEVWSLGGSKAQKDFLKADSDTSLLDGPSSSGLTPVTCAIGAAGVAAACTADTTTLAAPTQTDEVTLTDIKQHSDNSATTPTTPNSTTSTAPLLSPPNSPPAQISPTNETNANTMPAKTTGPVIITTTTIADANRFTLLGKDLPYEIDVYDMPKDDLKNGDNLLLDSSAGTTASTAPTPSPSTSPKSEVHSNKSDIATPTKRRKSPRRNHNNNHHQSDVNSIESISENVINPNSPIKTNDDLMDDPQYHSKETLQKTKKKKKKKINSAKEMDQLDGVPIKSNVSEASTEEDEKVVTCLYYTLMCCDCTIS